jgi:hypothetical protein
MDVYLCPWMYLDVVGCLWMSLDIHGCQWMSMDIKVDKVNIKIKILQKLGVHSLNKKRQYYKIS